jgi:hypothetical protein
VNTFWNFLIQAGLIAGFSFIAALLLCLRDLFSKAALRRRRRMPLPDSDPDAMEPVRPLVRGPAGWRRILTRIIAVPFGAVLGVIILPALCAMALAAIGANYRFSRHLAYRALRRKRKVFAFPLSFPVGLHLFTSRTRPHDAASAPGIA